MPCTIKCPCGQKTLIPDGFNGLQASCRKCKAILKFIPPRPDNDKPEETVAIVEARTHSFFDVKFVQIRITNKRLIITTITESNFLIWYLIGYIPAFIFHEIVVGRNRKRLAQLSFDDVLKEPKTICYERKHICAMTPDVYFVLPDGSSESYLFVKPIGSSYLTKSKSKLKKAIHRLLIGV